MTSSRQRILAVALLAGIGLVATWLSLQRDDDVQPSDGDDAAAAAVPHATAVTPDTNPALSQGPPDRFFAWPGNGESIRERWALLAPLAERGDAVAACRLGVELLECRNRLEDRGHVSRPSLGPAQRDLAMLIGLGAHVGDWEREAADLAEHRGIDPLVAENRIRRAEKDRRTRIEHTGRCDGLSPDQLFSSARWLRISAESGNVDAMAAYVGLHRAWRTTPGAFHDPEFARWRAIAPAMVERLLERGDPRAPHLIGELGHRHTGAYLTGDPLRVIAARRVRDWLATEPSQRRPLSQPIASEAPVDVDDRDTVTAMATAMAAHYAPTMTAPQMAFGHAGFGPPRVECRPGEAIR